MEEWLELVPFALFLLLALGGGLLKRYLEKQHAEKNAAERRTQTRGQEPVQPRRTAVPPQLGAGRPPTPAAPRRQAPPGAAVARRAIRQKVQRRGTPARAARGPARAEEKHEPAPVAHLEQRHLGSLGTGMVSVLRGSTLHPATERPAAAPSVAPHLAPGFLGNMLRGRNTARAIVLSEILGPPKGLRDL